MQHQQKNPQHRQPTRPVVFRDQSAGLRYLTRSDRATDLTTTWEDGNIYPVIEVDLSSAAHFARKNRRKDERQPVGASA